MQRLFRRGRVWYGWFYENGRRVTRATHCGDRAAAERVVRQWERDAAGRTDNVRSVSSTSGVHDEDLDLRGVAR